jgi:hypothetical protein
VKRVSAPKRLAITLMQWSSWHGYSQASLISNNPCPSVVDVEPPKDYSRVLDRVLDPLILSLYRDV